ncbi:uncharacterized protein M421DRAFT_145105 [Didymella exigua CBS 183.55]|uniref:Uncharacterized protein n=1 Tax=Didymella exigua CBS 183.55 TaxID=1150837 RepID=A0A6A5RNZ6_9PLEO|nr:uncharacterized protein M421DRAFT_145105 [Didymella exigua CBS 183.55]KAF1929040.1 hypothetical protein M421DRAFT_145105 [Didymella exigua CBS 183.55]
MSASAEYLDAMDTDAPTSTRPQDSATPAASQQTYRQIAASHIEGLNKLNSNLPDILALIAASLSQLTNNPIQSGPQDDSPGARERDMVAFSQAVKGLVSGLREALVDEINDLERYKVIPATMTKFTALPSATPSMGQQQQQAPAKQDPDAGVKNGGYGSFDVGVLNSKVKSGQVEGNDTLDRVKAVLDELLERSGQQSNGDEMAVDG